MAFKKGKGYQKRIEWCNLEHLYIGTSFRSTNSGGVLTCTFNWGMMKNH